jgi:hypothetical protein
MPGSSAGLSNARLVLPIRCQRDARYRVSYCSVLTSPHSLSVITERRGNGASMLRANALAYVFTVHNSNEVSNDSLERTGA